MTAGQSMNGPITVTDAEGRILRVIPVAVAIAERDEHEAKRKQRQAIAAAARATAARPPKKSTTEP